MKFNFKSLICSALAVLLVITAMPFSAFAVERTIKTDKTEYYEGEQIFVTATGQGSDWVGIYLATDTYDPNNGGQVSIYWYNVAGDGNQSGDAVNIKSNYKNDRTELDSLPAGEYKVVLFNDGGYTPAAVAELKIIKDTRPPMTDKTLTTDKTVYKTGEPIMVTATGDKSDWVAIFLKGDVIGEIDSIYWYYVASGHNSGDTVNIKETNHNPTRGDYAGLTQGEYKIALLENDTYNVLKEINITVSDNPAPIVKSISIDNSTYESGSNAVITSLNCEPKDWVGLYNAGDTPSSVCPSLSYFYPYPENTEYSMPLDIPAGEYKFVLMENDGYTVLDEVNFTVTGAAVTPSVTTDKTIYEEGDDINVTAVGSGEHWVGIYLKDDVVGDAADGGVNSIYWYYAAKEGNVSGTPVNIKDTHFNSSRADLAEIPQGEYKIVIVDENYDVIARTDITVTPKTTVTEKSLATDKTTYEVGDPIMVTATGTGSDWVGIYLESDDVDPDNGGVASIYWYYIDKKTSDTLNCSSGDTVRITEGVDNKRGELSALPAGDYKIVLLEGGGYKVAKEVSIKIVNHNFVETDVKEATCTESGYIVSTCSHCGKTQTVELSKRPHSYDGGVVTKEPSCTETGVKTYTCSMCNNIKTDEIPANGHHYAEKITKPATCTAPGKTVQICDVCGASKAEREIPALGHRYMVNNSKLVMPTCTKAGYAPYECSRCDANYKKTISATGHSYVRSVIKPNSARIGYTQNKCADCGYTVKWGYTFTQMPKAKLAGNTASAIKVSYSKVSGAYGYDIYCTTNKKHYYTRSTSYTISNLSHTKAYNIYVKPYMMINGKKVYPKNSIFSPVLKTGTEPAKASLSKVYSPKSRQIKITWKRNSAATGYLVQYSTTSRFTKGKTKTYTYTKNSVTSKTISKLGSKKKYYVRVRAYKVIDGKRYYGAWSSVKSVTTKK